MPPPHFTSTPASSSTNNASGNAALQLNDLPKVQRHLVRDAIQQIRVSLTPQEINGTPSSTRISSTAYESIRKLTSDPALQPVEDTGTARTSASGRSKSQAGAAGTEQGLASSAAEASANAAANEAASIRRNVSNVVNSALSHIFSSEMDQDSRPHTQLLVSYLHALHPILDPMCVVLEWWDVLLRPTLKNPHCNPSIARKAHALVVWAMSSTPSKAYTDEPAPSAVWPAPPQSAVLAADMARSTRKPGDAPYPSASTRSASATRSAEEGDARRIALFSTKLNHSKPFEPLRRFTQRIFDLYTSEASSASTDDVEDDDINEVAIDEPSPTEHDNEVDPLAAAVEDHPKALPHSNHNIEVGPTWKGNLEAIILTFGEEKPKAFFHHLSESFLDPPARIPILLLLTIFFRISSLHAYHVVRTPFVRLLILSLQLDTSKTSSALGSFALATLIPHIPNWIANGGAGGLPALLSILARIIDWRKLGPQWEERSDPLLGPGGEEVEEWTQVERISRRLNVRPEIDWKRLDTTFDTIMPAPPDAEKLFTFLYGIFPCNVIRFLRAPVDYLRKAEYESPFVADWDDIIDEAAVQNKCAPILRRHVLHPSLVDMDAESEISDKQRWRDHDAADITAECVCLHIGGQVVDEPSGWIDSRRPSLIDHLPSLLAYRSSSRGSLSSATSKAVDVRLPLAAVDAMIRQESGSFDAQQSSTPNRFYRPRTKSENLGRRGSMESPLFEASSALRRRDLSAQPGQHAGTPLVHNSPRMVPLSATQATLLGGEADVFLQNHVKLRYGLPLGGQRASGDRTISGSQQESLSRSSSVRSTLRTFNLPRSNLAMNLMQPALASQTSTTLPSDENRDAGVVSPGESIATTDVSSPHMSGTGDVEPSSRNVSLSGQAPVGFSPSSALRSQDMLGSPAISSDAAPRQQTKSRLKEEVRQTIAYLKQENLQLRNELNYEIGQKDQMLRHIGRIHRDRMRDTVLEDERQNLYQTVRMLRTQLKTLRANQDRTKTESIASKSRHANWENELNAKLKSFREEKKVWVNEVRQLQIAKEDNEALIAKLEHQLHENANEVFELREQCKRDASKVQAIVEYEEKIQRLEECLEMWDADMRKFEAQKRTMESMANQYEELSMLLDAMEADSRKAHGQATSTRMENEALQRSVEVLQQALEQRRLHSQEPERIAVVEQGPPSRTTAENEERGRLRARIEQLEAELLHAKARQEEWQMEELCRRLQEERQLPIGSTAAAAEKEEKQSTILSNEDHDVAPLDLGLSSSEKLNES